MARTPNEREAEQLSAMEIDARITASARINPRKYGERTTLAGDSKNLAQSTV